MTDRDCELDRQNAVAKLDRLIEQAVRLRWAYLRDQADHATPTRTVEPTSGGGPSDPTMTRAATPNPVLRAHERDINRCTSTLRRVYDEVTRKPAKPDSLCVNCRWQSATHPKSKPKRCHNCYRYRQRTGSERPDDVIEAAKEREYAAEQRRRRWAS